MRVERPWLPEESPHTSVRRSEATVWISGTTEHRGNYGANYGTRSQGNGLGVVTAASSDAACSLHRDRALPGPNPAAEDTPILRRLRSVQIRLRRTSVTY